MTRKIRDDCPAVAELLEPATIGNIRHWLEGQATVYKLTYLLAHADDGVIWGRVEHNQILTSDGIKPEVSPPLLVDTLQQARIFSPDAELLLWRDGDQAWHARLIRPPHAGEAPTFIEAIDEPQILWGTHTKQLEDGFTLMTDGAQGLCHVVPLTVNGSSDGQTRPLRLLVRHYVREDNSGFARIVASRLMKVIDVRHGESHESTNSQKP